MTNAVKYNWIYKGEPITRQIGEQRFYIYLFKFPNGRYYIGKSSFFDSGKVRSRYWGTNLQVKRYLAKHGKKGVKRIILMTFATEKEAYEAENHLTKKVGAFKNPKYMNEKDGGKGAASGEQSHMKNLEIRKRQKNSYQRSEVKKKISEGVKKCWNDPEYRSKMIKRFSGENNPMFGRTGEKAPMYGKTHTDEVRQRLSEIGTTKTGLKSNRNKYFGKTLSPLLDHNPYEGTRSNRLSQCYNIIAENNGIEFGAFVEKCNSIGIDIKQARGAMLMMVDRKQITIEETD